MAEFHWHTASLSQKLRNWELTRNQWSTQWALPGAVATLTIPTSLQVRWLRAARDRRKVYSWVWDQGPPFQYMECREARHREWMRLQAPDITKHMTQIMDSCKKPNFVQSITAEPCFAATTRAERHRHLHVPLPMIEDKYFFIQLCKFLGLKSCIFRGLKSIRFLTKHILRGFSWEAVCISSVRQILQGKIWLSKLFRNNVPPEVCYSLLQPPGLGIVSFMQTAKIQAFTKLKISGCAAALSAANAAECDSAVWNNLDHAPGVPEDFSMGGGWR